MIQHPRGKCELCVCAHWCVCRSFVDFWKFADFEKSSNSTAQKIPGPNLKAETQP